MTKLELIKAAVLAIKTIYTEYTTAKANKDANPVKWKRTKRAIAGIVVVLATSGYSGWSEYQKFMDVEMAYKRLAIQNPFAAGDRKFDGELAFIDGMYNCAIPTKEFFGIERDTTTGKYSTSDQAIIMIASLSCPVLGLSSDDKFEETYDYMDKLGLID